MSSATALRKLIRKGILLQREGDVRGAQLLYEQALSSSPDDLDALHLYGLACHQLADHATAVSFIRRAVEQAPHEPVLRNNLARALHELGALDEAMAHLRVALQLRPDYAGAHQNMGNACSRAGKYDAALRHARKAVRLDAGRPEAWYDLGLILLSQVSLDESVAAFRKALALRPGYPAAATSLIYTLNLLPGTDPAETASEIRMVAAAAFAPQSPCPPAANRNARIRVGYVSGDFRAHAVNFFFEPVLEHHDRRAFEVFCYSNVQEADATTRRLRLLADHWRDVTQWNDATLADQIRADGIDVLVDLSGHTKNHRLGAFARKPAARQLTWLGFPNTTGLEQMDYMVVDQVTVPADADLHGAEKPLRLENGFACFRPPANAPPLQPAPCLGNGYVTLGCLHKLEKVNERVIETWARILRENDRSRLLIVRDQVDEWHKKRLQDAFARHGVDADRLDLFNLSSEKQGFLSTFGQIDVLLDSFPWSGHTIACCALWMGVPVVSLSGDSHAGRMVASVLKLMGLDELLATDVDDYCRIVADLCLNEGRMVRYRSGLRRRMEESAIRNERGFTIDLEAKYLALLGP